MLTADFDYAYDPALIALTPQSDFRTLYWQAGTHKEISRTEILQLFEPGDVLVVNDTKVLKRRVFTQDETEILFLRSLDDNQWEVLFPARSFAVGDSLNLPDGISARLIQKGLPQIVQVSEPLTDTYFIKNGELALPPYIQQARGHRHAQVQDEEWYQTQWAETPGSLAAPTASLHFTQQDLRTLQDKGVVIEHLTLHVGIGTFLPIKTKTLQEHKMHAEYVEIPKTLVSSIAKAKSSGKKVFALGTTVTRALESWQAGRLEEKSDKFFGATDLFIQPGFEFKVVDVLMTNFHQPQSTLLALVSAFAGRANVLATYTWAVTQKFRLFSYGDLSIWKR